jgi:membrane associated rhomboid family serine protease
MVKYLLIACVGTFVLQHIAPEMIGIFGLTPLLVWKKGFLWQIVTYIFLHGDLFHLLWNMLALYMFGCEMERRWGSKFFLQYFFVTGIGAGFFTLCLTPTMIIPTVGASGAIYGILLAFALYYPNQTVYFWLVFPIKVKYFVLIIGLMTFYFSFLQTGGNIAHLAHLGGMVCGLLFLRPEFVKFYLRPLLHRIKAKWRRRRYRIIKRDDDDDNDQRRYH